MQLGPRELQVGWLDTGHWTLGAQVDGYITKVVGGGMGVSRGNVSVPSSTGPAWRIAGPLWTPGSTHYGSSPKVASRHWPGPDAL